MPFSVRIAGSNDIIEMSNLLNDITIEGGSMYGDFILSLCYMVTCDLVGAINIIQ